MKIILINAPDGQYYLPVSVVAHDRASYYEDGEESYRTEYDYTYGDTYTTIDWLLNNMDWDNVSDDARKFSEKVLVLEDDFWTSSDDFEIVDGPLP
jgi:hypothetical protein